MDVRFEFNPSAFKHGATEADIRHAYETMVYEAALAEFPDKYAVIGFDTRGNPLEILYNPMDGDTINVFHAMKVRGTFLAELGL
ncbi:MAG: hypothetical protein Pg6C_11420 [Treponemataceae bacterium]|nr:MAG: hypothetical protein Pg6C_11420 [Treponemataceae bacterium]